MSTGDLIGDEQHVARMCKGSHLDESGQPSATAFMLRAGEDYLSVNWLENLNEADRNVAWDALRGVLAQKLNVANSARLGLLNVGECRAAVSEGTDGRIEIRVIHEPVTVAGILDESHSGIYDHEDDLSAAEKLAESVFQVVRAK